MLHRLTATLATALALAAPAAVAVVAAPAAATATSSRPALHWAGQAGGQAVRFSAHDLTIGAYSARAAFLKGLDPGRPATEQHHASWKPLSVVGPYVSVEEHIDGFSTGAAHPYDVATIVARDAARGAAPASLDRLFKPADIHAALMGDKLIRTALQGAKPRDLPALLRAVDGFQSEDCAWGITKADFLTRFAFAHVKGGQVAVRLGLSHGCEVARGGLTVIGIYLPIPPSLAPAIAAARAGRAGFLLANAPKGLAEAHVGTP